MSLEKVLNQIRKFSVSERDKGDRFEKLIKNYFLTEPQYKTHIKEIWTWSEFGNQFGIDRTDLGTDIVVETHGDDFWGIQCKCYDEKTSISLRMLETFLSDSTRSHRLNDGRTINFTSRFLVTTTNQLGSNVLKYTKDPVNPLITLTLSDLKRADVDWKSLSEGVFGKRASKVKTYDLRPHQKEALDRALAHYQRASRGKMIMACGTGKTFTSLKIAEELVSPDGVMVYCVPSIALISQTLKEYLDHTKRRMYPICVCSDSKSGRNLRYDETKDAFIDISSPVTTNSEKLVRRIEGGLASPDHDMVVVFSTYQSIDVVIEAQSKLGLSMDLTICDEAHRTASVNRHDLGDTNFVKVHDNGSMPSEKRLYMTATPKIYHKKAKSQAKDIGVDVFSMDDEAQFGREFYRIKFGEAISRDLLTDYKVITLEVRDDDTSRLFKEQWINRKTDIGDGKGKVSIKMEDAVKMVGLISVLGGQVKQTSREVSQSDGMTLAGVGVLKRNLLFTRTIKRSIALREALKFITENPTNLKKIFAENHRPIHLETEHIDGSMNAAKRTDLLDWLREDPDDKNGVDPLCRVLSNVRCMSEGVDVPTLDSAIFWDSKQSEVDIVQSVGRIMRKAEGKDMGYIIVPIHIDSQADQKKEIEEKYKVVWKVLRAMRSHDERLDVWINGLRYRDTNRENLYRGNLFDEDSPIVPISLREEVVVDPKELDFINNEKQGFIYGKIVQNVGDREYWDEWVKDIAEIVQKERRGIQRTIREDQAKNEIFEKFVQSLQENINPSIDPQETMSMVSQHIVVKPIFEALFGDYDFVTNNPVSFELELLLEELRVGESLKTHEELQRFYERIIDRTKGLKTPSQKQGLIKDLYHKFFQKIDPELSAKLGIVYTPIEIVDFMIRSVDDLLQKEFEKKITDQNVRVMDPFTGTGSYVVQLLQSGLIESKDFDRKYEKEISAREINLLAYYTADVNIESTYHEMVGKRREYDNVIFTDTFQVEEPEVVDGKAIQEGGLSGSLTDNYKKIQEHRNNPVEVIIGNPPYSVSSKKSDYPTLNQKLRETYGAVDKASSLTRNTYVKAFRWATDKLDEGIIAFITPSSWLTKNAGRGLRHYFEKEFGAVYVYDLKGGYSGAHNVFGIPHDIAITYLIKKANQSTDKKAQIYYHALDEKTRKKEKLETIKKTGSVLHLDFEKIVPNRYDDWLNQRVAFPKHYIPVYAKKGGVITEEGHFFRTYSNGYQTANDAQLVNFSKVELQKQVEALIDSPPPRKFGYVRIGH